MVRETPPEGKGVLPLVLTDKNATRWDDIPPMPACEGETTDGMVPAGETVLVSACLAGRPCRYDGSAFPESAVEALVRAGDPVLVCPEVAGGLGTPRPPAEIVGGDGRDVLEGRACVLTQQGADVTAEYLAGAHATLMVAEAAGARAAVLKARSPSCGVGTIRDGSFSGATQQGDGVTAALLQAHGIRVTTEEML